MDSPLAAPHVVEELLSQARFEPIHEGWLAERDRRLEERLRSLRFSGARRVLLLNATMGVQLFPSIADFFALLQRVHPDVHVTSASYFDEVDELSAGVARKGLHVIPVSAVAALSVEEINRFDVIIAIGPSDALSHLMTLPGIRTRLVLLDLAFYHQLIDASGGEFLKGDAALEAELQSRRKREASLAWVPSPFRRLMRRKEPPNPFMRAHVNARVDAQRNPLLCYSCQPASKVQKDLFGYVALGLVTFRWFAYIPLGLRYRTYYRSNRRLFDVALLGTAMRDYGDLDPQAFPGMKFLFLGDPSQAPQLARLRSKLDLTIVDRVNEETYARLLALCRCVVLPMVASADNVLLSAGDAMASGIAIVTPPRPGMERLAAARAPIVFYEPIRKKSWGRPFPPDLARRVHHLLGSEDRLREISDESIAFAREQLDIYAIAETIVREQLL